MAWSVVRMHAPSRPPTIERPRTITPPQTTETFPSQVQPSMGSTLVMQAMFVGQSLWFPGPSTHVSLDAVRVGELKLEIPEKYSRSQTPTVHGWLNKMEQYFLLMKYLDNIWVDVITTCIAHATQAWLDKFLQDIQLGRRNLWADWALFRQEMEDSFTTTLKVEHVRCSLMGIRMKGNIVGYIQCFRTLMYKVPTMT